MKADAGQTSAAAFVPASTDLAGLRSAAESCRGCHLYADATQVVFGAGPASARVIMVGEQPGDAEDKQGEPFVGPAGKLLDRALAEAGIDRSLVYVTNAVKHFKFTRAAAGKRRIHATPDRVEITACRPWLIAEFAAVRPTGVVVLGATAAKALFGPSFRVTKSRGEVLPWRGARCCRGPAPRVTPRSSRARTGSPWPRFTRRRSSVRMTATRHSAGWWAI
jgi:uracil-DNA glycosylase